MSLGHTLFDESIYELLIGDRRWVENTEGLVGVEVLGGLGSEREGARLVVSLMVGCCMIAWWWCCCLHVVLKIKLLMICKLSTIFKMLWWRSFLLYSWSFIILRSTRQHTSHLWMSMRSDFACPSWTREACKERTSSTCDVIYIWPVSWFMIEELLDRHYPHLRIHRILHLGCAYFFAFFFFYWIE